VIQSLRELAEKHSLDFDDLLIKFKAAMENDIEGLTKLAQAKQDRPWRKLAKDKSYYRQDQRLASSFLIGGKKDDHTTRPTAAL
jgi:hypothetical protein